MRQTSGGRIGWLLSEARVHGQEWSRGATQLQKSERGAEPGRAPLRTSALHLSAGQWRSIWRSVTAAAGSCLFRPMKIQTLKSESKKTGTIATKIFSDSSCRQAVQSRVRWGEVESETGQDPLLQAAILPKHPQNTHPAQACAQARLPQVGWGCPHRCLQAVVAREDSQRGGPAVLGMVAKQNVCRAGGTGGVRGERGRGSRAAGCFAAGTGPTSPVPTRTAPRDPPPPPNPYPIHTHASWAHQ